VEQARREGPRHKLVSFALDSSAPMLWGGELVLRDGVPVGQVTSAAWAETLGASAGLAYLWDPAGAVVDRDWIRAGSYAVDVNGVREPAAVSLRPLFDPDGARIRP
jgi:glycine cleavage system aminomethyltransferase T